MTVKSEKGVVRAFLDFFVLFSGISTASNLARTQRNPPRTHGIFLFRRRPSRDQVAAAEPAVSVAPAVDNALPR